MYQWERSNAGLVKGKFFAIPCRDYGRWKHNLDNQCNRVDKPDIRFRAPKQSANKSWYRWVRKDAMASVSYYPDAWMWFAGIAHGPRIRGTARSRRAAMSMAVNKLRELIRNSKPESTKIASSVRSPLYDTLLTGCRTEGIASNSVLFGENQCRQTNKNSTP